MKIGIVDRLLLDQEAIANAISHGVTYQPPTGYLKDYLLKKGDVVKVAEVITGLVEDSGGLSRYDAFLIHPGMSKQKETIQRIGDEAPNSVLAIVTFNVDNYISKNGTPVFSLDLKNYDRLYAFLEERLRNTTAPLFGQDSLTQ